MDVIKKVPPPFRARSFPQPTTWAIMMDALHQHLIPADNPF
jgi:hypothetical protein